MRSPARGLNSPLGQALLRACVLVTLLSSLAVALALRLGTPATWWVELLRYVPYLAFLGPAVAVAVASCWLGWAWRCAAGLAVAVVMVGIMDLSVGRAAPGSQPLRMMTYNIKSYLAQERASGYWPIVAEVTRHDPDLLVMQDAQMLNEPDGQMVAAMATLLRDRYSFRHGQYIVVSRYPLQGCRPHDLAVVDELADYVRCVVVTPAGPLDLLTVHFLSPREGLNATRHERLSGLEDWRENYAQRLSQSRRLADAVALVADRPLILAGDLNAPDQSPVVQGLLRRGLRDTFAAAGLGWGFTHGHSLKPYITFLRIDHILVNRWIGVHQSFAGGREGSQHRPVIADLWLRPGP
jgi:endonuclease/exonuclease/phosphatase family metal-dependent hydrolase